MDHQPTSPPQGESPLHHITSHPAETAWLHCIVCDCVSGVTGAFVDDAGLTRCPVCGTPIIEGYDDGV